MQTSFMGVDVAKVELVISVGEQAPMTVSNDTDAISGWLASLLKGCCIAMESTGRYHQQLAHLAQHAGFAVYVLNARDVYFYAKTLGARAKSDAIDCVVIRRYVQEHHHSLQPWQPGTKVQQQLHALLTRRAQMAIHQAGVRQTLKQVEMLDADIAALMRSFNGLLQAIDQQVQRLIAIDDTLLGGCQRLGTITSVGPQTSALLTELFSRLSFANSDALVAYGGLDPRANDSGIKRGGRRLSKRGPCIWPHSRPAIAKPSNRCIYILRQRVLDDRVHGDPGAQAIACGICCLERFRAFQPRTTSAKNIQSYTEASRITSDPCA